MADKLKDLAMDLGVTWLQDCFGFEEREQILETKINLLKYRASDMIAMTKFQSGKKRKKEVEEWLKQVERKESEFTSLKEQAKQARFYSRIQLVQKAETMIEEIEDLIQQGAFSGGLLLDSYEIKGEPLVPTKWKGQAFEDNMKEIWTCLVDERISSIGIYGMGGVGKTTLATHVHNNLLKEKRFSGHVYWITASQEASIIKLQNEIAKLLHLHLSYEDNEMKRAAQLFLALKRRKKFVLILDDLWTHFDVEKIGIPLLENDSKLIITSRSLDVCKRIGCQKAIKVKPLSNQEAWLLFIEKLGCCNELTADVEEITKSMAKKCAGLPLGVITMAGSMRGMNDIHEWRDALEELEEPFMRQDDDGVYKILEYSFNRLRDHRLKDCFLYCSLYPEDYEILRDELITNFILEGLMDKRSSRLAEFDQGHAILNRLENACLLEGVVKINEDATEVRYVKMHDLMRAMALKLTKTQPQYMVKAGIWLKDVPGNNEWREDLEKVSLSYNIISSIPLDISPNCPKLSTLKLWGNELRSIPDSFFAQLAALQVLDLSSNRSLLELPNCLSNSENLTSLLLSSCRDLRFVPSLANLKELRELDMSDTKLSHVPEGLERLVNLKCLNMVQTNLEIIPEGILSKLSQLQSLGLPRQVQVQVEELESLKQLEEFIGGFSDMDTFSPFVRSRQRCKRPRFYVIQVGSGLLRGLKGHFERMATKRVVFSFTSIGLGEGNSLSILPEDIQELEICACHVQSGCLNEAFSKFTIQTRGLTDCLIEGCHDIKCILNLSSSNDQLIVQGKTSAPLQILKHLRLFCLPNFTGFFEWEEDSLPNPNPPPSPPQGTFSSLNHLFLDRCGKIKKLFTTRLLQQVQNLQVLKLWGCNELEEIITEDEGSYRCIFIPSCSLPNLKKLSLLGNPKLRTVYNEGVMYCDTIERIEVINCQNLKTLSLSLPTIDGQISAPPALQAINISLQSWKLLEWDNTNIKNILQPFVQFGDF